jgi:hypothetical protein
LGPPEGRAFVPRAPLMLMNPPPAVIRMSRIIGGGFKIPATPRLGLSRDGVHDLRPLLAPPSTAGPTDRRPRRARPPSRNDEGNREGDGLELAPLFKETRPRRKPAKEEHREENTEGEGQGDAEVLSDPTAGVTRTETAGDSRAGPSSPVRHMHGCYSVVFGSKCSLSFPASARVWWITPSR